MSGPTNYDSQGLEMFTEQRPAIVQLADLMDYITEMRDLYNETSQALQEAQTYHYFTSVKEYGAKGDGFSNDTTAFNNAIQNAKQNKGIVFIPEGVYMLDEINLMSGVNLVGVGQNKVFLKARQTTNTHFIKISEAPVQKFVLNGFSVVGNINNQNQNGFYFEAIEQTIPAYTGGLWYGALKDIEISGFPQSQIYLNAQNNRGDLANQFLLFENVICYRINTITSRALKATGQLGQATFINCQFDGQGKSLDNSLNVELSRKFLNGSPINDETPSDVKFLTCTFQESDKAVLIDRSSNISFESCWFENLNKSIEISASANAISINENRFANACGKGDGTGYGILVGVGCNAVIKENYFLGVVDFHIKGNEHLGISIKDNFSSSGDIKTSNVMPNKALSNNTLSVSNHKTILVNTSTNSLKTITSQMGVGESVTLKIWGVGGYLKIESGGNITGKNLPINLGHEDIVTIMKIDLTGVYQITSVSSDIFTSPNGMKYKQSVNDSGQFVLTPL